MHDQTIKGCLGGNANPQKDIPKFINNSITLTKLNSVA